MQTHPAVYECAVIGAPSEKWGEEVKAIVVNLWTKEITANYPPELDQFWDLVNILEMTRRGVTVEEELAMMDQAGIEKGLLVATTGWIEHLL